MIRGLTQDKFLDQPEFAPIFERAEKLDVPVYLHPGLPPKGVADIYYSGLPNHTGMAEALACYGWGWHSETALHVLRLLFSGVLDTYQKLLKKANVIHATRFLNAIPSHNRLRLRPCPNNWATRYNKYPLRLLAAGRDEGKWVRPAFRHDQILVQIRADLKTYPV